VRAALATFSAQKTALNNPGLRFIRMIACHSQLEMKPATHLKWVKATALPGLGVLLLGFGMLGVLGEKNLAPYLVITAASIASVLIGWIYAVWFLPADCPKCGRRMKMRTGERTVLYICSHCGNQVDSGHDWTTAGG
jgi:hypothetical protein